MNRSSEIVKRIQEASKQDLQAFVDEVRSKGQQSPLDPKQTILQTEDDVLIAIQLYPFDGRVHLSEMIVMEGKFKQGAGTKVMEYITSLADKKGIPLSLSADPIKTQDGTIPKEKLKNFYKRFGFQIKRGDFMIRENQ